MNNNKEVFFLCFITFLHLFFMENKKEHIAP